MSAHRKLLVQPLANVKTHRQRWAFDKLVSLRVLTMLSGEGGIGKSTILAWFVAGFTQGTFKGDFKGNPVSVGFIAAEDDSETTLVPRLVAAGANLDLVQNFSTVVTSNDHGDEWRGLPEIKSDLSALREGLIEWGIRVLIIDPIISIMEGDSIKAGDVRRNLDPIAAIANELDIAVILVGHFNKSRGDGNASNATSGSGAFRDIVRSSLLLAVNEENGQRVLSVDKSNYSPEKPSYAFDIQTVGVTTDDGERAFVGRAHFAGHSDVSVHELLRKDDTLGDLSRNILQTVLDAPGEVSVKEVAEAHEVTEKQASTYLARLVTSGRIVRGGRGRYSKANTANTTGFSGESVESVGNESSLPTLPTQSSLNKSEDNCRECGEQLHAAITNGIHPTCEKVVA